MSITTGMQNLIIQALLSLGAGTLTTREVRDATGRADLSVDSVGRILGQLGLEKKTIRTDGSKRRAWCITRDALDRLSVASVDTNTPVSTGDAETQNHRANHDIENQKELASQTQRKGDVIMVDLNELRTLLNQDDKPQWAKVVNKTANHVILPHPEQPDRLTMAGTLGPHEVKVVNGELFSADTVQGQQNKDLERLGLISIEHVDSYSAVPEEDEGRRAAFTDAVKLADPQLEYLASQVLNFPGGTLPDKVDFTADGLARPDSATIVWAIVMHEPQSGEPGADGAVKYDFLAEVYRPFLQVVLERERLWKNRPGIVALLEKRIDQLSDATLLAAKSEFERLEFRKQQGLR